MIYEFLNSNKTLTKSLLKLRRQILTIRGTGINIVKSYFLIFLNQIRKKSVYLIIF